MTNPQMPFRLKTNAQGFRGDSNLEMIKHKLRVLLLGDSFTFGPFLHNFQTYPYFLQNLQPNTEIINGGVAGYTITDETGYFQEKGQYCGADLVVLQVLDNDLPGLSYYMKNQFDRKRQKFSPSEIELRFYDKIKSAIK
jgi:lysophospholipase L1-like esterase